MISEKITSTLTKLGLQDMSICMEAISVYEDNLVYTFCSDGDLSRFHRKIHVLNPKHVNQFISISIAAVLISKADNCINCMVEKYNSALSLLCTIPGIDRSYAITAVSETGADMAQFGSSKRLCCWAGLTPGNNKSAGKKKFIRILRAGVYLKPTLVQATHVAVKDKHNSCCALKYERIAKRRGKKGPLLPSPG